MRFLLLLLLAAASLAAQTIPKNVQKSADGTNAITESLTFGSGRTLTLNGTFAGTPTGGTLDLSALTLTLPAASAVSGTTVNGYFADPSTNASFSAAAWRTDLALVPGTNVQAYSAALDTFAANGSAYYLARANHTGTQAWSTLTGTPTTLSGYGITDAQPLDSDLTAIAALSTTAYGRSTLSLADAAAGRTYFGVVIGTDVQAYDADLAAIAALSTTAYGRGVLVLADAAAAQTYFGTPANVVSASAVIADNAIVRGDGGSRGVQDSAITIADVSGSNVTLSSTTGNALTLATPDTNRDINFDTHGTGKYRINMPSDGSSTVPGLTGGSSATNTGFWWDETNNRISMIVGGVNAFQAFPTGAPIEIQTQAKIYPSSDNAANNTFGRLQNRWNQIFVGPNGLKIGDGTDGPTITADGTADTFTLATVASNANLNLNTHGTGGVVINSTSAVKGIRTASATLDFPSVAATGGTQDLTITVTGAATGDSVALGLPAAPAAGVTFDAWVSASNTVTVRATNATGVSVDPASASYRATVTSF